MMMWMTYRGKKLHHNGTKRIRQFAMANKRWEEIVIALKELSLYK
jgi:hypothetical protein